MTVTLAASAVETFTIGGVAVETADGAAAQSVHVDWAGNSITITYSLGTGVFTPSNRAQQVTVWLDMASGGWSASSGQSGKLGAAALTNVIAQFKALRNQVETFAVNQNLLPGSQVPWP